MKAAAKTRKKSPEPHRNFGMTSGFQWALLALCLAVAWAFWPAPVPTPPAADRERTNWDGFLAVAYGGIRDGDPAGRSIGIGRFREHMEALQAAGYHPISLEDARDFLIKGRPLPEKAILLTFDDGRRDTAEAAEEILGDLRFPATMLLRLDAIERSDHFFATWHTLRALAATGRWSFGAKGIRSFDRVAVDGDGNTGLYLTSLAHLSGHGRAETEEEWRERISREIRGSADLLKDRIEGWRPIAFAFPFADGGRTMPDGGEKLRKIVAETFPLSFERTGYGFNHWKIPRGRLTRLVVSPAWTGPELVQWLDAQGVRRSRLAGGSHRDWVHLHGFLAAQGSRIVLEPREGRGAEAWLAGSEHWRCLRGEVEIEMRPSRQSWIYLRSMPGSSFLRIGWSGKSIEVQARAGGDEVRSLARGEAAGGASRAKIRFELTERRIRFSIDGGRAPERSFPIPRALDAGMAGLGIWHLEESPAEGQEAVAFEGLQLEPRLPRALLAESIEDLRKEGSAPADVIAPRWYSASGSSGNLRLVGEADPALIHLAAYRGASIWPVLSLESPPDPLSIQALVAEVDRVARGSSIDGIILDARPARTAGPPLEPEALKSILAALPIPTGLLVDQDPKDILASIRLEKIAWLVVPDAAGLSWNIPPDRLLIADAPASRGSQSADN